jgi:beta-glucosidase
LKGFARILLQPGESKTITFRLPADHFAFYDKNVNLVLEPGKIDIMLGSSSHDIRLECEFEIFGPGKMLVKERVFVCPVEVR